MRSGKVSNRRKIYKRKMIEQKFIAIIMLLICVFVVILAMNGKTPEDSDATPVLLFAPMGIYLLFTKECWLN